MKAQKQNALKFTGEWTKKLDQYIFDKVDDGVKHGHSIKSLLAEVAEEISAPKIKVHTRWYAGNKQLRPLRDRLNKETKELVSKGDHLRLVQNDESKLMLEEMNNTIKQQQEILLQVVSELHNMKETNNKLYKGMGSIWRSHKKLKESHDEFKKELNNIKEEINKYNKVINETYTVKVNILEKRLDVQSKKLKKEREELQKAKSVIADSVINNRNSIDHQSFKMDRNGNLTKIN
jgi:chromosome segregation ATPase